MQEILWVVFCLAAVFGLLFLFLYMMKRFSHGVNVQGGGKMRVLDRVTIGREGMLLVVSVAGKLMLISATPQRIEKLCDLEMTPEEYAGQLAQQSAQTGFSAALAAAMRRGADAKQGGSKAGEQSGSEAKEQGGSKANEQGSPYENGQKESEKKDSGDDKESN